MSPLAGIAMSFAIVAVLVLPSRQRRGRCSPGSAHRLDITPAIDPSDRQIEANYLASNRPPA